MTDIKKDILRIKNCETVKLSRIPVIEYDSFIELNSTLVKDGTRHLSHYFAVPSGKKLRIFSVMQMIRQVTLAALHLLW
jgi:hypothetical protein